MAVEKIRDDTVIDGMNLQAKLWVRMGVHEVEQTLVEAQAIMEELIDLETELSGSEIAHLAARMFHSAATDARRLKNRIRYEWED